MAKTAHLPKNAASENKLVTPYGRRVIDGSKTIWRQSLEKIARSE